MVPEVQLQQSLLQAELMALARRAMKTGRVFLYGKKTVREEGDLNDGCSTLSIPPAMKPFSPIKSLYLLPKTNHHHQKDF